MSFQNMPDLGPMFTPEGNANAVWVLERAKEAATKCRVVFDIPYGEDFFQQLDIWLPREEPATNLPVLVYVHGGGWQKGHKEWNSLVAERIVEFPAILVSPNHRLAPSSKYPQQLADIFCALKWVHDNIDRYKGDRNRIFLGGHSSGGHLAALATMRTDLFATYDLPADLIKACFPLSAPLDLRLEMCEPGGRRQKQLKLFLERDNQDREASVTEHTAQAKVPMFLSWGSADFVEVMEHNRLMVDRMAQNKTCVFEYYVQPGGTHNGTQNAWLDPHNPYVDKVLSWIANPPDSLTCSPI